MAHRPHIQTGARDAFVGRTDELEALGDLVRAGRTVVLAGPPGIGKSALAARLVGQSWAGEWCVVDLHGTRTPIEAWERVAATVDAQADTTDAREVARTAGRAMRARKFQGAVLDGGDALAESPNALYQFREALRGPVIVTTRRRFALRGATALDLGGLPRADAIKLFERETSRWGIDAGPREAVLELCERLEGNPLAISIAASRADVLPPTRLLERLESGALRPRRGSDLTGLDEAIATSWELLDRVQREVLSMLVAFKSSFSIPLAEKLVASDADFYDAVAALVDSSWLVRIDSDGEARVRMWDSMRRYVLSTLDAAQKDHARRRFVQTVTEHAIALDRQVPRRGGEAAYRELRADESIVLRALELALEHEMPQAIDLAVATRWLLRTTADPDPYAEKLREALSQATARGDNSSLLRAIFGELLTKLGDVESASELLEAACQNVSSAPPGVGAEILRLSSLPLATIDPDAARDRLETALETALESDVVLRGQILERLGFLKLRAFRLAEARDLLARSGKLLRQHASLLLQGPVTIGLGYVAMRTGHVEGAVAAFQKSVEIYAASGATRREAEARFNHGVALTALGDLDLARQQMERARAVWKTCADDRYLAIVGARLALVAIENGHHDVAREELHQAIAAGQQSGDWNNRAIAEAYLALVELAESGRVQSLQRVRAALRDLEFGADPDAAATALLLQQIGDVQRGDVNGAREHLDRLAGIQGLVGDEDAYLIGVIETLTSIGEAWLEAEIEGDALEEAARGVRARVPSILNDPDAATEQITRLPNPLVRICARALLRRLNRPDTVESLPEPVTFLGMMPPSAADTIVTVHRLGHWFKVGDGEVVDLVSRRPFRLILKSILRSHMSTGVPGRSVEELISDGWPGEIMEESSGKNRVYNAIRQLRELGLEGALVTGDAGYCFSPKIALQVVDTTPSQVTPIIGF